jgi:hypothetical protein
MKKKQTNKQKERLIIIEVDVCFQLARIVTSFRLIVELFLQLYGPDLGRPARSSL